MAPMRPIEIHASEPRVSRVLPSFRRIIHRSRVTNHGEARLDRTRGQVRDVLALPPTVTDERSFAGHIELFKSLIAVIEHCVNHAVIFSKRGVGKTSILHIIHKPVAGPDVFGLRIDHCGGVIAPAPKDSLADRLYSRTVQRLYQTAEGDIVIDLIACGGTENEERQLRRPECCNPALGFLTSDERSRMIDLRGGAKVPIRRLSARRDQHVEQICAWTRIGDYLPLSAVVGMVTCDGVVRISTLMTDEAHGAAMMIAGIARQPRHVLLETRYPGEDEAPARG